MNTPESSTSAIRPWIWGIRRSYWALTSTRGVSTTGLESRGASSQYQVQHQQHGSCDERDVERVVKTVVVASERPADAGERERPGGRARDREERVAPERHAEHPGRDRDERAHYGGDAAECDGPLVVALEPPFGPLEPPRVEVKKP